VVNHNRELYENVFLITFANAGQYGNNAYISPDSLIDDGFLDMCILVNFPKYQVIDLAIRLFNKTMPSSPYFRSEKIKSIQIEYPGEIIYHLDGESLTAKDELNFSILPVSLNILTAEA
jgi:diacylglycerol kinase family enzyme